MTARRHRLEEYQRADAYCATSRKWGWTTEERATAVLAKIRATGRMGRGGKLECRVYACPWCGAWHMTSKPEVAP